MRRAAALAAAALLLLASLMCKLQNMICIMVKRVLSSLVAQSPEGSAPLDV